MSEKSPVSSQTSLIPWVLVACLALVAALATRLYVAARAEAASERLQASLADLESRSARNQLEAERILDARQLKDLGASRVPDAGLAVILLEPARASGAARGVAVLDPASGAGQLRLFGTADQPEERDYQLWIEGPGPGNPTNCGVFHAGQPGNGEPIGIRAPIVPGCRLVLVDAPKGASTSLEEAKADASIILASAPYKEGN